MRNRFVLEICVQSVDHAVAAERGGAHRIELCSDLSSGGITPSAGLMQTARRHVHVPIHVLVRPRAGDFCYSSRELEIMRDDIRAAKQFGMDGVVLGILQENARIDIERTKALVKLARPLPVTFHRAFDAAPNPEKSLEEVIETGARRILTSGGRARATEALSTLAQLVRNARERILLIPCGGINSGNLVRVATKTLAREFHSSVGTSARSESKGGGLSRRNKGSSNHASARFERKVAKLVELLDGTPENVGAR